MNHIYKHKHPRIASSYLIFSPDQPNHPSIVLLAHYLRIPLLFTTAKMLVPRPVRSPDSPGDQISTEGNATIILVLGILIFLGLTYAIQGFMARFDDKGNRQPVPVRRLVDT